MDARWYRLATLDSAIVSMPDGTSAAFYQRDPDQFRDLLRRTIEIHERLYREWPALSQRYRDALGRDHLAARPGSRPSRDSVEGTTTEGGKAADKAADAGGQEARRPTNGGRRKQRGASAPAR